jgi:hypothetical protein
MNASSKILCDFQSSCTFFNNPDLSAPELLLRKFYCLQAGCQHCIIYHRLRAGKSLPAGICPDGNIKLCDPDPKP